MASAKDEIAKAEARMKRLRDQLAASPIVEVLGVVSASGASGGQFGDQKLWTLQFTLDAWRIKGSDVQDRPLDVQRQVNGKDLERYQEALESYTVVRLKARVVEKSVLGTPQALLVKLVGVDTSDAELNAKAAEMQKPVTFTDSKLGTFTLDRRIDWFTAKAKWLGNPVSLNLSATKPKDLKKALKAAHTLWKAQKGWSKRIGDFAVKQLLPLKNDNWLGDDEAELNAKQFRARMTLEAITVSPSGSFDFWHNDGDLFWGHSIQISGNLTKGPTDADIPG
jgi:hypothetical protein